MKKLKHITVICKELYEAEGASAVYDFVRDYLKRQPNSDIDYKDCTPCEANTPQLTVFVSYVALLAMELS